MAEQAIRDFKRMYLRVGDVKLLFVIYLALMLLGLIVVILAVAGVANIGANANKAIIYCASMSFTGTGIFYSRKLYKALINNAYTFSNLSEDASQIDLQLRRLGTISYFVIRPIFGVAFSVVVYSVWRLSLFASGAQDVRVTEGFLYTTIALGFISGFLAGRLLTMLEGYGAKRLNGLLGGEE